MKPTLHKSHALSCLRLNLIIYTGNFLNLRTYNILVYFF